MSLKEIQRALLAARIPAKIYEGGMATVMIDSDEYHAYVIVFRVRWRDRHRARELLEAYRHPAMVFRYRPTLMPWECRSLLKVVSYIE
jgi:hypothetical protein